MTRRFLILILALIAAGLCGSVFALGSGTWAYGDIMLVNGERLDSVNFEMPLVQDTRVKVKINGKKHTLEADSIECIILWSKKYPEEKHLIKSFIIENVDVTTGEIIDYGKKPIWLACQTVGDNCSKWRSVGRPSFHRGHLQFNYNYYTSHSTHSYILKKDRDTPCYIPDSDKKCKSWIKVYFKDDPAFVARFESGEYDTSDWGYKYWDFDRIVKDYCPSLP